MDLSKYSPSTLYAISGQRLSVDFVESSIDTISQTLAPLTERVLVEFISPAGFILLPGLWEAKLTMRGTGHQSEKYTFYRIEVLQNGVRVLLTDYQSLRDSFQTLINEIFLPGHRYIDRLTLKVWIKNTHTNTHSNTFELQVNQNKSILKR